MKIKKGKMKNSTMLKPKRNITALMGICFLILVITGFIFFSLSKIFETETYYVLNADIPAKTQITSTMLKSQETAKGSAPKNALDINDIQTGTIYSKYPLYQGDVISSSNAGANSNSFDGIPDDWIVTSLTINTSDAVNGALTKGDYFDIVGISGGKGKYIATNVLVLGVTGGSDSTETSSSSSQLVYTVGMPADYALNVQVEMTKYETIKFFRSPISSLYEDRDLDDISQSSSGVTELKDLMDNTDSTFAPVIRDENSRPVNEETCSAGTVEPSNLCTIHGFTK